MYIYVYVISEYVDYFEETSFENLSVPCYFRSRVKADNGTQIKQFGGLQLTIG